MRKRKRRGQIGGVKRVAPGPEYKLVWPVAKGKCERDQQVEMEKVIRAELAASGPAIEEAVMEAVLHGVAAVARLAAAAEERQGEGV